MNKVKTLTAMLALVLTVGAAQAQVTPQAVIANAPSLPTPEQWAANGGHTEAFKAKIAELNSKLGEIQAAMIPTATQDEMMQAQRQHQLKQERQREQNMKDVQRGKDQMAAMGITEADLIKMQGMSEKQIEAFMRQKISVSPEMQVLKSMGITDADMDKMSKMSEKQGEVYMKKRLADNGFSEADFRKRMEQAGVELMSEAEMKETDRREREAQAQGEAMQKAQEAQEAYMEQMQVTSRKIGEAEKNAADRIAALWQSSKPAIDAAEQHLAELGGPEEIMRGTITQAQYDARANRVTEARQTYWGGAYRIWHEYILAAQGHLKFLMPYAQAFDDAKKTQADITSTGNATYDRLQGMSNAAIGVAGQYLNITESEPQINL